VNPTTSIQLIAELMQQESVGVVCVCDENNRPLGVLTDRDIVVRVCANKRRTETTLAQEVMTPQPLSCRIEDDLGDIEMKMQQHRTGRMLVVDEEARLVGIVSLSEIWHYQSPLEAAPVSRTVMDREFRAQPSGGHYPAGASSAASMVSSEPEQK
jgi:CBS-domain-containing membrane protein